MTISGLRTLLVEDEALVAMLLEDMLVELGHQVMATVSRRGEAFRLIDEMPVDLAVLDINLDGEQTYPIASVLSSRQIPFIFSTGYDSAGIHEDWRHIPLLQKPFQAHDLAQGILSVVRKSAQS